MGRCIIITGGELGVITREELELGAGDYVLCCDRGYAHAKALGIVPQLILGDFDSYLGELPTDIPVERAPKDKDDTDTMLAVRWGLAHGYRSFLLVAACGGRLDHTIANLQTLAFLLGEGATGEILGANERAMLLEKGSVSIKRRAGYTLSVFAYGERATGVGETGVFFPLEDATLTNACPLGVSNRITAAEAVVSVEEGVLLILQCREG